MAFNLIVFFAFCVFVAAAVTISSDPIRPQLELGFNITCQPNDDDVAQQQVNFYCLIGHDRIGEKNQCAIAVSQAGLEHNGEWTCQLFSEPSRSNGSLLGRAVLCVDVDISVEQALRLFLTTKYGGKPLWEIILLSGALVLCVAVLAALIRVNISSPPSSPSTPRREVKRFRVSSNKDEKQADLYDASKEKGSSIAMQK